MLSNRLIYNYYLDSNLRLPETRTTMPSLKEFIDQIKKNPETIAFQDVINLIEEHYQYSPTTFINGTSEDNVKNIAGENEGSCKIFSFAKLTGLDKTETLHCFGDYYRQDVLNNPDNTDHANIRTFIKYGWDNVTFKKAALTAK